MSKNDIFTDDQKFLIKKERAKGKDFFLQDQLTVDQLERIAKIREEALLEENRQD